MADKPTKAELAKLPGGAEFDVDNASEEDYAKHISVLRRRKEVADASAPVQQVALVDAPAAAVPAEPNPNDIKAMKNGEVRYFDAITWAQLDPDKDGWEETVAKPASL